MSNSLSEAEEWKLSAMEAEILRLFALGADEDEFALQSGLSGNDTQAAIKAMLQKLGARNRSEAIIEAHKMGYL